MSRKASSSTGINSEQLKLLQLCFGEHEFGATTSGTTLSPLEVAGIHDMEVVEGRAHGKSEGNGDSADGHSARVRADGNEGQNGDGNARAHGGTDDVVLEFDPYQLIEEKLEHNIELETVCHDLRTFEGYLQNRILQHVNEDVYDAFVSVSGELVGVEEQLQRVAAPLSMTKSRLEGALVALANKENVVLSKLQAAQQYELRRRFHVCVAQALLMYDALCTKVESLERIPFFAALRSGSSSTAAAASSSSNSVSSVGLPSDACIEALHDAVADLYDLDCLVKDISLPPPSPADTLAPPAASSTSTGKTPQESRDAQELQQLEDITAEALQYLVGILNQTFLCVHRVVADSSARASRGSSPKTPALTAAESSAYEARASVCIRKLLHMFAMVAPEEFVVLYRDTVVRGVAEEVLSWKAASQARTSVEGSVALIDELCEVLRTTCLTLAPILREVFGGSAAALNDTTSSSSAARDGVASQGGGSGGFYPVAQLYWPSVCNTVITRMVFLFLPGIASTFHAHFSAAHRIVRLMEDHCATPAELHALRSSTEMTLWNHKWNIDVYHTLRATEFHDRLEHRVLKALRSKQALDLLHDAEHGNNNSANDDESAGRVAVELQATNELMRVMEWVFDKDVFLFPLTHKFLRDAMSALRGYMKEAGAAVAEAVDASTTSHSSATMDAVLLGSLLNDFAALIKFLDGRFRRIVEEASCSCGGDPQGIAVLQNVLQLGVDLVTQRGAQSILDTVVHSLVAQCLTNLQNVRSIKATYSHTKKPMPSAPSWFVPTILVPLTKFRTHATAAVSPASSHARSAGKKGASPVFPHQHLVDVQRRVIDEVTAKLREFTKETIVSARKTEESLGKLRRKREEAKTAAATQDPTVSGGGSGAAGAGGTAAVAARGSSRVTNETATDRDKMVVQLYLDAHEFGSLLRPFGINKESYAPLQQVLKLCRRANWILGDDIPEPAEVEDDE